MGCDIHGFVEYEGNEYPDSRWSCAVEVHMNRNYDMFAYMAGVRNRENVTPIAEPRGLPANLSPECRDGWRDWEVDAHHASWLDRLEMRKVLTALGSDHFELAGICNMMDTFEAVGKKSRLVFWFDN